jgi:hypothetical protein
MIPQFQHKLSSSFLLWFDNYLLTKGQAYTNTTGRFYYYEDERIPSTYKVFGSPYKQWVSDYSITGATIPSGVFINGSFSGRATGANNATSSRILDFENGRALISGAATGAVVTGAFATKDFNIYYTNETEEDLLIENKFIPQSKIGTNLSPTYIQPYDQVVPAIYICNAAFENKPFAFGGMDQTTTNLNAVVIAENPYQLDGVLSIFADSRNENIVDIPFDNYPFTEYGDLKSGYYNYQNLKTQYQNNNKYFIERVKTSKMNDKPRKSLVNDLYVGFIDFDVSIMRYPRI